MLAHFTGTYLWQRGLRHLTLPSTQQKPASVAFQGPEGRNSIAEIWEHHQALLMFPISEGWDETYEDPAHTTLAARETYFGQSDHVRMFGRDVRDRIRKAGFNLSEFTAREPNVARYGLHRGEKIFVADKSR